MKKLAQIFEQDIDELIQELVNITPVPSVPSTEKLGPIERYQLPVKHTKGGLEIDEKNKPWVVGYFSPDAPTDHRHPQGHHGIDLAAPKGSPIYPIASGEVIEAKDYPKGGITLKISHENGQVISYYAHLNSRNVSVGQTVDSNTVIGAVGDSGNARGIHPHLHLEVKVDGQKIDPFSIFGKQVGSLAKKAELINNIEKILESKFSRLNLLEKLIK